MVPGELWRFTHLSDDETVAKMGHPGLWGDDETVAKMGAPGYFGGMGLAVVGGVALVKIFMAFWTV